MNIGFIPVRGGSKSIPLKNIKLLNGKPLVYWVLKSAVESKNLEKIVVATDSETIKSTVLGFGFDKVEVYDRRPENAQDTSSTESVMLEYIESAGLDSEDKFVLIQATSPLLKSEYIDEMFDYLQDSDADSVFSGVREKQFHWIETENGNKLLVYYSLGNFVSRQLDAINLLGGIAKVTLKSEDGRVSIDKGSFMPVVTHYNTSYRGFKIYPLSEYTNELAMGHGVAAHDGTVSVERFAAIVDKVFEGYDKSVLEAY